MFDRCGKYTFTDPPSQRDRDRDRDRYFKPIPRTISSLKKKEELWKRDYSDLDRANCRICNKLFYPKRKRSDGTIDNGNSNVCHKLPASYGGTVHEDNVFIGCASCNNEMKDKYTYDQYVIKRMNFKPPFPLELSEDNILFCIDESKIKTIRDLYQLCENKGLLNRIARDDSGKKIIKNGQYCIYENYYRNITFTYKGRKLEMHDPIPDYVDDDVVEFDIKP